MSPLLLLPLPLSEGIAMSPSSSKRDGLACHCDHVGWLRTLHHSSPCSSHPYLLHYHHFLSSEREELFLVAPPSSSKRPLFAVTVWDGSGRTKAPQPKPVGATVTGPSLVRDPLTLLGTNLLTKQGVR